MTHEHLRKMIALLEPIIEEHKILDGLSLDIARMSAAVLVGLGVSVGTVVVGKDYIAVLIEHLRHFVISAGIFAHSVRNLHDTLGAFNIVPEVAVYRG